MAERKAFNFYRSYYEVAKELPKKHQLSFIMAILDYQFEGVETTLTGMAKFAYMSQKHSIDKQLQGYKDGIKGGAPPKGKVNPPPKGTPNQVQEKGQVQEKEKGEYIPPYEDFKKYALSKKGNLNEEALKLKYESWKESGWKNGNGKKIMNWKSTLLNTIPYIKEKRELKTNAIKDTDNDFR
jgi:hypothetical protein